MEVRPMASRRLPAIIALLDELDEAFPGRDKASDGEVGDARHAESVSNHNRDETGNTGSWSDSDNINEVHARDIDKDLGKPGWSMERVKDIILARCRAGQEERITEIIYNRRIWTRAKDWRERKYAGPNPHDHHLHLSFAYGSGSGQGNPENITAPFGILAAVRNEEMISARMPSSERWSEMASREEVKDACREALTEFFWDAYNASKQNSNYLKAKPEDQKRMRNARDTVAAVAADDIKGAIDRIDASVTPNPPQATPKAGA